MIGFFPDPYPDELFYSVCARFNACMRYPNYRTLMQVLFGKRSNAIMDLPCNLGYFANQLPPGRQYTADVLIAKHTLFPYYQPFLSPERAQQIRKQMIDGPGRAIHRRIGITGSAVMYPPVLRYCPVCAATERATLGECYWHRLHQAPGVIICSHHEVFLEESTIPISTYFRAETFYAAEESILNTPPRSAQATPFLNIYKQIALNIAELLETALPSPEQAFWSEQYTALLAKRGYLTPKGLVRAAEFLRAFLLAYPLESLQTLGWQIKLEQDYWHKLWMGLKGRLPYVQHPLFHILILQMLGSGVADFFRQPFPPSIVFGNGPWPCINPVCNFYRQAVIVSYQLRRSKSYGRPVGQFACTCGFTYNRTGPDQQYEDWHKGSVAIACGEVWENKLRELWGDCSINLKEMCRRLGVTDRTLNRKAKRLGLPVPRHPTFSSRRMDP